MKSLMLFIAWGIYIALLCVLLPDDSLWLVFLLILLMDDVAWNDSFIFFEKSGEVISYLNIYCVS